ncbi:FAD-dependent oxidoreductase [Roseateles depolymerans]|uniref:FAD dependent oxidoreductase n=1 Tax=Roseateles depolymerans TaxID=76731 RepID=A0A0U3E635_9BURK|nr:FAD-dependent oxidoreductase [Roseateles depolymerans]ALV08805.1 FAD dependent oxidoreductase [Roseateles depolymerans]REG20963.1 glycine oxidase [Roseateles depolymerans]
MARIVIAGAGLAGRLCAWALVRSGHAVTVCDPSPDAQPHFDGTGAAAFAAAGMLSPLAEQEQGGARVAAWGWRSLTLWAGLVQALRPAEVPFRRDGSLLLAHRSDLGAAQRILALIPGAQALDSNALHSLEPALVPGLHGWLLPGEGLIGPVAAMHALAQALTPAPTQSGISVDWRWGCPVLSVSPGQARLASGEWLRADWVIDTRGLGTAPDLPVRGVRGEIVTLSLPGHGLRRPVRLLHPRHRVYLVPRTDEELAVGASEIESGDRSPVSLRSAVELMAAAHSIVPALAEARILRLDRHLRPALPDNLPMTHHEPGLLRLNGLYRHGWLLAPALVEQLLAAAGLAQLHALVNVRPPSLSLSAP